MKTVIIIYEGLLQQLLLTKSIANGCGVSEASNNGYAQDAQHPIDFWNVYLTLHLLASMLHLKFAMACLQIFAFSYNCKQQQEPYIAPLLGYICQKNDTMYQSLQAWGQALTLTGGKQESTADWRTTENAEVMRD